MKKKIIFLINFFILIFVALVFYKGLKLDAIYSTKDLVGQTLANFSTTTLNNSSGKLSNIDIKNNKYSIINVWASWCGPCRLEHPIILRLSRHKDLNIFGINYKDKKKNAISYLNKFGNPYKKIGLDLTGFLSVDLGFFGVPETILINKNEKILLKYVGPLNENDYNKIVSRIRE